MNQLSFHAGAEYAD